MEIKWKLVLSDSDTTHVRLMQSVLENNGIQASMIDKSDSELPTSADSELYVPEGDETRALAVLAEYTR